jgi:hypothetical protein
VTAAALPGLYDGLAFDGAWAELLRRARLRRARERLPLVLPLDAAARAVAEAYSDLGELSAEAAASEDGGYETLVGDVWV